MSSYQKKAQLPTLTLREHRFLLRLFGRHFSGFWLFRIFWLLTLFCGFKGFLWFGFWRICSTLFLYRLSDRLHLRHKDSILPNRDPEQRRIPDVPFVNWKQPSFVIRRRRVCKRITDNNIPRHSKQTHLQIAHHAHDVVNVLRHKQHIRLIIDAFLSAFVCERHQQGPSAAGRITDRNPSPASDFLLKLFRRGRYC